MLWMRTLIVYSLVIVLYRFMGRALQLGSRSYDIAVQVMLGSVAANLITTLDISVWRSFSALGTLAVVHLTLSFLSLWNPLKKWLVGNPTVLVENGQILKANLIENQISVEELTASLREKGYHTLTDVEFALLEASGKLSVIPRSQARPVTPRDLHLSTSYEGVNTKLVTDGTVDRDNLRKIGLTEDWVRSELAARGVRDTSDVLYAALDTQGRLFVVRNQDVPFLQAVFRGIQAEVSPGMPPLAPVPPATAQPGPGPH